MSKEKEFFIKVKAKDTINMVDVVNEIKNNKQVIDATIASYQSPISTHQFTTEPHLIEELEKLQNAVKSKKKHYYSLTAKGIQDNEAWKDYLTCLQEYSNFIQNNQVKI